MSAGSAAAWMLSGSATAWMLSGSAATSVLNGSAAGSMLSDAAALPAWQVDDDDYVLTFARPANVSGITYIAESSPSLMPGSWMPVANGGTANSFIFVATATRPRLYLRVRVTVP